MENFPIEVDAEVDASGTGKLIDAAVDAFSPATEVLGLLGDCVRLARAEVAILVTKRAKKIADESGLRLVAPPLKFLVPFYEKASLEESTDSEAIERWAQLLVGASSGVALSPHFISILAEMNATQAQLLKSIYNGDVSAALSLAPNISRVAGLEPFDAVANIFTVDIFEQFWRRVIAVEQQPLDRLMDGSMKRFSGRGIVFSSIQLSSGGHSPGSTVTHKRPTSVLEKIDYEVLEALNLVRLAEFERFGEPPFVQPSLHVKIAVYVITNLGIAFLSSVDGDAKAEYRSHQDSKFEK